MKQQILVDMDGVLADVYTQSINMEFKETGRLLDIDSLTGKDELSAFPNFEKHVNSIGFFRTAPLIKDSQEGLNYLNNKYKVLIVSSATEFPNSLKEKLDWLQQYFPFITWQQIILCGKKDSIKGDIMIDDHPKNLDFFNGRKILFTQPHNKLINHEGYERVDAWAQILEML